MDRELSADEIESLLPAYVLDAVEDEERAAIEAYLARSPEADDEVVQFRAAAALLAVAGGAPPEGVWERLEPHLVAPGAPPPAPVLELDAHRARPQVWRRVAAVAAVAALFVGVVVWAAGRDSSQHPATTAALAADARRQPGARTVALVDSSGATLATVVVLRDGTGYLESSLPVLPHGRTYQLWSVGARQTISLGVLGRDPSVIAFAAPRAAASLAVTDETAGGVTSSTHAPVAVGDVRA